MWHNDAQNGIISVLGMLGIDVKIRTFINGSGGVIRK